MIYEIIVKYAKRKKDILKGIEWMKIILTRRENDPDYLDTYACLLYNIGKKKEAIDIEKRALKLSPENGGIKITLDKMLNNKNI